MKKTISTILSAVFSAVTLSSCSTPNASDIENSYDGGVFSKETIRILSGSENKELSDILARKYHIAFEYSRVGSLDMVTADQTGRDYLFPSSRTALEYYKEQHG